MTKDNNNNGMYSVYVFRERFLDKMYQSSLGGNDQLLTLVLIWYWCGFGL